jgi:hypothetical protein
MNVIDLSSAKNRSISKNISLDLPVLPHQWGYSEMDLSREIDRILTRLDRLQRMLEGQPLPPQLDTTLARYLTEDSQIDHFSRGSIVESAHELAPTHREFASELNLR